MKTLSASVDEWVKQSKERINAVIQKSSNDLINEMQTPIAKGGHMPVDTGFLRNSIDVTLNAPSSAMRFKEGDNAGTAQDYSMTIAGFDAGDTLYAIYTANYAPYVHYGVGGRPGRMWVDLAAQNWQTIVNKNALELRASVASATL